MEIKVKTDRKNNPMGVIPPQPILPTGAGCMCPMSGIGELTRRLCMDRPVKGGGRKRCQYFQGVWYDLLPNVTGVIRCGHPGRTRVWRDWCAKQDAKRGKTDEPQQTSLL